MKEAQEKVKGLISLLKPQEPTADECERACEKVTLENVSNIFVRRWRLKIYEIYFLGGGA